MRAEGSFFKLALRSIICPARCFARLRSDPGLLELAFECYQAVRKMVEVLCWQTRQGLSVPTIAGRRKECHCRSAKPAISAINIRMTASALIPGAHACAGDTQRKEPSLLAMESWQRRALPFAACDRLNEPVLTQWDAWGNRIDHIELTPLWRVAERIAAEHGVVATAYEGRHGHFPESLKRRLAYLHASTDIYSCPLAMTDGAARTLLGAGNQELIDRAIPHLLTRNAEEFWTSGQWMTELTGGSDVGLSETVARRDSEGVWRLYGRKWFTSATTSQML